MPEKNLKANVDFVEKEKAELLKHYRNKFIVVFKQEVVDSFDTYEAAAKEAIRMYGTDEEFLVYHMSDEEPTNFAMEAIL